MREIIAAGFITLDGGIQAPGGAQEDTVGGLAYGGWMWACWHGGIGRRFFDAMSRADAILLHPVRPSDIDGSIRSEWPEGFGQTQKNTGNLTKLRPVNNFGVPES